LEIIDEHNDNLGHEDVWRSHRDPPPPAKKREQELVNKKEKKTVERTVKGETVS